ncbi:thiamine pyrophosphate-binding protein [Streptomyces sp. NPDC051771]|uniref:thiamine pyrophosphate-binding protein n=1 Tax=Streptomyces sp. NPDC051771 TaxID=3154847 RepID=UPI003413A3CD
MTTTPGTVPPQNIDLAEAVLLTLARLGFAHFTGVPCAMLQGFFRLLEDAPRSPYPELRDLVYVPAPHEDAAISMATGMALTGGDAAVFLAHTGPGHALAGLTALNQAYEVPLLMVVGRPGKGAVEESDGLADQFAPPGVVLDPLRPEEAVGECYRLMQRTRRPAVLIVTEPL